MERHYFSRAEYDEYLNSPEWKEKKRQRADIDGHICRMCGVREDQTRLECHHIKYTNFGREDVYSDLITLCEDCHRAVHRMMCRPTGTKSDGSIRYGWGTDLPTYIRDDLRQRGLM